jgi:hypothetical protein
MDEGGSVIQGNEENCDYVINRDCNAEPFHDTDITWCGVINWRCAFLPGRYMLQERYITCTYRCNNGTVYTMRHYETRVELIGCCGVWPPLPAEREERRGKKHIY